MLASTIKELLETKIVKYVNSKLMMNMKAMKCCYSKRIKKKIVIAVKCTHFSVIIIMKCGHYCD